MSREVHDTRMNAATELLSLPVRQVAYFVEDARASALRHQRLFGSGPYYVAERIPLRRSLHRGVERPLDHTSAYGQWGRIMVEFVQQNNSGPSAFHDLYPEGSGRFGLHHMAIFVDDLDAEIIRLNGEGFETALHAEMNDGFAFAMIDMAEPLGHMLELYEGRPQLTDFYDMVEKAARNFTGDRPIRDIKFS